MSQIEWVGALRLSDKSTDVCWEILKIIAIEAVAFAVWAFTSL